MARPSKLTPEQWSKIERRLAAGESAAALSREFKVSQATLSVRFSKDNKAVSEVAHKLAEAQTALAALPVAKQYAAVTLAEQLREMSSSLASAATLGAQTAHRLHALANAEVSKVDDAEPLKSMEALKGVGVLTKLANESSHLAVNLISANKGAVPLTPPDNPSIDPSKLSPQTMRELIAARGR